MSTRIPITPTAETGISIMKGLMKHGAFSLIPDMSEPANAFHLTARIDRCDTVHNVVLFPNGIWEFRTEMNV